jgi:hypothetical protein
VRPPGSQPARFAAGWAVLATNFIETGPLP